MGGQCCSDFPQRELSTIANRARGLVRAISASLQDRYRETLDPYRDCPDAEMRDAQVSVVGAVSIGSFEVSR